MSAARPAVSVVMPVYNAARYIDASIRSVLAQTFTDFELIVVDDCSTDGTRDIVERIAAGDPRVRCHALTANMGAPAGPRNIGIREAAAQLIAFLDADDLWHPAKLEHQMAVLARTGARFCSTRMVYFVDERETDMSDATAGDIEWVSFMAQLVKLRTPLSSVLAEKALFLKYPFNESPAFKAREDLDCWLHIHEEIGRSVKIKAPMMAYRLIPGQISGSKGRMLRGHLHVLQQYRLRSGRTLAPVAWFFTATHFASALYFRYVRKGI